MFYRPLVIVASISKTRFHVGGSALYYVLKSRNEGLTTKEQYFRVACNFYCAVLFMIVSTAATSLFRPFDEQNIANTLGCLGVTAFSRTFTSSVSLSFSFFPRLPRRSVERVSVPFSLFSFTFNIAARRFSLTSFVHYYLCFSPCQSQFSSTRH